MANLSGAIESPPLSRAVNVEIPGLVKFKDKLDTPENFQKTYDAIKGVAGKSPGLLGEAIDANNKSASPDPLLKEIEETVVKISKAKKPTPPETGTFDKDTGEWTYTDASGAVNKGYESDLYPDMIQALDQITGPNEAQAKLAATNFKKQLGVYVGRATDPITYDEWWQKVEAEAKKSASDPTKLTPDELHKAAKKLSKDENASFYVLYPKSAETLPKEFVEIKRFETARDAGKMVINRLIEEAKGKAGVSANYNFGALTEFYILLREAESREAQGKTNPPGQIDLLTSLVSSATRTCMRTRPDLFGDAVSLDFATRLEKNTNYYNNPDVDPVRHMVDTFLKPYAKDLNLDLTTLTQNFNPNELVAYAITLRDIEGAPSYILRNLDKLSGAISSDSISILQALTNTGNIPRFRQALLDQLGIHPGFIEARAQSLFGANQDPTFGIEAFLKRKNDDTYVAAEIPLASEEHKNAFHHLIQYGDYLDGKYKARNWQEASKDFLKDKFEAGIALSLVLMLLQQGMDEGLKLPKESPNE